MDQDLVQGVREVRHTELLGKLPVDQVTAEKVTFFLYCLGDGDLVVDLLLGTTFYTEVPELQRINVTLKKINCVCSLIH
jgi:hypothetical protein